MIAFKIILEYSPRKNKAKINPEYSMLYPATISASASGKSNGVRLVSAKHATKKITNKGKNGTKFHPAFCSKTILIKFRLPTVSKIGKIVKLIKIS
jgi:hypothetical protein